MKKVRTIFLLLFGFGLLLNCMIPRPLRGFLNTNTALTVLKVQDSLIVIGLELKFPIKSIDEKCILSLTPVVEINNDRFNLSPINIIGSKVDKLSMPNYITIDTKLQPQRYCYTDSLAIPKEYNNMKVYYEGECYLEATPQYELEVPTDTIFWYSQD